MDPALVTSILRLMLAARAKPASPLVLKWGFLSLRSTCR
jgi:hypothetical protein